MKGNPTKEDLEAVDRQYGVFDESIIRSLIVAVPSRWTMYDSAANGAAFRSQTLQVLMSVCKYDDGQIWVHVSAVGRTGRNAYYLPTWENMKRIKEDFIGNRWAYSVLPPTADYVNQNKFCLHLYARLDGTNALPDFTHGLGVL